jgi:hypothetical protein
MADIMIGDRVEITRYRRYDDEFVGQTGIVTQVDSDSTPYLVLTADEGEIWAEDVRQVAGSDREALVARALELLKNTPHTGADVIAMAAFLAGE